MKTERDRRKYIRGRIIKDLDDLMRQDVIFCDNCVYPIGRGWFMSWHLRHAQGLIRNRKLFCAVKNGETK
jgi:hypothetical protein